MLEEPKSLTWLRAHLSLQPFDTSNPEGRASERYRLAAWSFAINVLSQFLGMVVMVLSVRLVLPYFGAERFGLWMMVAGFASILSFLDLGLANALANRVARLAAEGDSTNAERGITAGLVLLAILALILGPMLYLGTRIMPWGSAFGIGGPALVEEVRDAAGVLAVLFSVGLISLGIQKVLIGLQAGYLTHSASAAGYALSLGLLLLLTEREAGMLPLLLATYGVQIAAALLLLPALWRRGDLVRVSVATVRREWCILRAQGRAFFVLQIGGVVAGSIDLLIVASVAGGSYVATFSVLQRLFQFVSIPLQLANGSLWGGYGDAHARGDRAFVRRTLKGSLAITGLLVTAGCTVLVVIGPWLIDAWTTGIVVVGLALVITYAAWVAIESVGNALGVFMNATGILGPQVAAVILTTPLTLAVKYLAMESFGLAGMFLATIVIYLATVTLLYGRVFRKQFDRVLTDPA